MRTWHGFLTAMLVVALAGTASAQGPALGVFFDEGATQTAATFEGGLDMTYTAYIYAVNANQTVGGVAFQLVKDSRITILNATFPAGIQIGELSAGIQVGFTECFYAYENEPVLVATMTLYTGPYSFENGELEIAPYPRAGAIQLSDCQGNLQEIQGMMSSMTILPQPMIGIYFDPEATQTQATLTGGLDTIHTAYIYAVHTEQMVGGTAFKLTLDSRITLMGATFPEGIQIGSLLEGIQIGFKDCSIGYGAPVLCSTLSLWTGGATLDGAELRIDPYPRDGAIQLSDCDGNLRNVAGGVANLTVPVGAETDSWGRVKALYSE